MVSQGPGNVRPCLGHSSVHLGTIAVGSLGGGGGGGGAAW